MSDSQQSNVLKFLILNFIQSWIIKKVMPYFTRSQKKQQRKFLNIMSFFIFSLLLFTFNFYFHKLSSPPNLYDKVGVMRKMTNEEIKIKIQERQVEILVGNQDNISGAFSSLQQIKEIKNILTHNARRLTYDTFGLTGTQYAWAFMSPNFLISVLIGSSIFYVIMLIMNIAGKDNKYVNLKGEIILIIIAFIWQTETLMHSQNRLHHSSDYLDFIFPAFPIFQRRQVLKYLISPISMLLQNFNTLFIYSTAETRLNQLISWMPSGYFMPIQNHLFEANIKNDQHLQQSIQISLKQLEQKSKRSKKSKDQSSKQNIPQLISLFKSQRSLLKNFFLIQQNNIYKDQKFAKLAYQYLIPKLHK